MITQDTYTDVTTHLAQPTRQRASSLIAAVNATLATFPKEEQIVLQILDINNTKVFPFWQVRDRRYNYFMKTQYQAFIKNLSRGAKIEFERLWGVGGACDIQGYHGLHIGKQIPKPSGGQIPTPNPTPFPNEN